LLFAFPALPALHTTQLASVAIVIESVAVKIIQGGKQFYFYSVEQLFILFYV